MVADFIFMNSSLYLLHPLADDSPIVGGRSQRYFEFTTRVSSPSTLYVAFILVPGRQSLELDVHPSSSRHPSEIWAHLVAKGFVGCLAVARSSNVSMRHALLIENWKVHSYTTIGLYSCVVTVTVFSDFLVLSIP